MFCGPLGLELHLNQVVLNYCAHQKNGFCSLQLALEVKEQTKLGVLTSPDIFGECHFTQTFPNS